MPALQGKLQRSREEPSIANSTEGVTLPGRSLVIRFLLSHILVAPSAIYPGTSNKCIVLCWPTDGWVSTEAHCLSCLLRHLFLLLLATSAAAFSSCHKMMTLPTAVGKSAQEQSLLAVTVESSALTGHRRNPESTTSPARKSPVPLAAWSAPLCYLHRTEIHIKWAVGSEPFWAIHQISLKIFTFMFSLSEGEITETVVKVKCCRR